MTAHASRLAVCLVVLLAAVPAPVRAQSLADVARAANAKRKEQPRPGKVYTNGDLRADITPSPSVPSAGAAGEPAPAASAAPAPSTAPAPDGGQASADGAAKDEKYWKGRMASAREALERAESFAAALQSQINGLTADFVNRDDPAQRAQVEQRRTKAVADLERAQREIEGHKKAIAAVEDEARKAGVPAGWLR